MAQVYRLLSGKISRLENGERKIYKAPYDFIPTPGELTVNKFRMQFIEDTNTVVDLKVIPDVFLRPTGVAVPETAPEAAISVPVDTPANTPINIPANPVSMDISKLDIKSAIGFVNTAYNEDELDKLLLQESDNKPRPRKGVLIAIEQKRLELNGKSNTASFATGDIAVSEIQ